MLPGTKYQRKKFS